MKLEVIEEMLYESMDIHYVVLERGERISAIACMSLLDVKTSIGGTDGDDFYDFVHTHSSSTIQWSHSVVILDNCAIHHVQEISEVINDVGSLIIYHILQTLTR